VQDGGLAYEVAGQKRRFIDGLAHLARGLGFRVGRVSGKRLDDSSDADDADQGSIVIGGRNVQHLNPVMPHKRIDAAAGAQIDPLCDGFTVAQVAHCNYYGFEVDGNGRVLMHDFVVTHNSGKGTQADLLVSAYGLVHLSTGDLLRKQVRDGTALGLSIKEYLDSGALVPDALITRLTLERLEQEDCKRNGWLLDGYPRTPQQAQSLIDAGLEVNKLIMLAADRESLVQRVSGRRFDPKTGTTYHIKHNPPPAGIVASRCIIRADDREEVIRARLDTYEATVAGVVRQFHDVVVVQSDARAGIVHVFAQIVRALEQEGTRQNVAIRTKSANQKRRLTARL
jgi:adenylate kinase